MFIDKVLRTSIKKYIMIMFLLVIIFCILTVPVLGKKITVQTPPIPAAIPFLWMQDKGELEGLVDLDVKISSNHQRAISLIAKNDIDMMVTGGNVGAKIYNRGIDVKLLNMNTWAVDYLLTYGFEADSWSDLKGKSLGVLLKGGPLDFLTRYFLKEHNIKADKVKFVYKPLPGVARYFMTGKLDSIILPEPLVTVTLNKNDKINLSLDIQEEWGKLHNGDDRVPFVGLFVSGKFARENPEYTEIVNGMYKRGVKWVNNNPTQAAQLASEYFNKSAKLLQASFKRVNLNCYPETESRCLINTYFKEIMKITPEMLGGRLPDEEFYY